MAENVRELRPKTGDSEKITIKLGHADVLKRSVAHKSLDLGLRHYRREDLEAARAAGRMLQVHVLVALHAGPAVKAVPTDRMT